MKTWFALSVTLILLVSPVSFSRTASKKCGYERWAVKTGQDSTVGGVSSTPIQTTIADLAKLKSPLPKIHSKYPPQINTRLEGEFQIVTVSATVTAYRSEADSDIHLIIKDGSHSMVAEIPDAGCMSNLTGSKYVASPWINQVMQTRTVFLDKTGYVPVVWKKSSSYVPWIHVSMPVTITGVTFFDWPHRQRGSAKNCVEIHPVLSIQFQ